MSNDLTDALEQADAKATKLLLEAGADPNVAVRGQPALVHVAQQKKKALVKLLVQAGADVNAKGRDDVTPLLAIAAGVRDPKLGVLLVAKGADLNARDSSRTSGMTALHHATQVKKLEFAEWLLEAGADIEARDGANEESPLLRLCRSESGDMSATELHNARWLLEKGANPNAANDARANALHLVAENGPAEFVLELLQSRGAKVTTDKYGNTPLHYCTTTSFKNKDVWDALVAAGVEMNAANRSGDTALHEAVTCANLVAAKYFVERGADPKCRNEDGATALDLAAKYGKPKIEAFLKKLT